MSWYRTYRPQRIADLHITSVREALLRILASGEFSHSYLLAGPKGTGKTSAARILAKVLNCEVNRASIEASLQRTANGQQQKSAKKAVSGKLSAVSSLSEPCNTCSSCLAITNGSSLSVTEIDAASNRGIDDIRILRERIGLSPADGVVSVFIIDEVHMLTTEAFNALLKVLEEPPAHVVFILATTDQQKMPLTVISRCTIIPYRKATPQELVTRLQQIAAAEKISVDEESLLRIAIASDGSFRDGVKVFEQLAVGRTTVTMEDIEALLGPGSGRLAADLLSALLAKDEKSVLAVFATVEEKGMDGVAFQKEALSLGHSKLIEFAKTSDPRFGKLVSLLRALAVPIEPLVPIVWLPFELACLHYAVSSEKGVPTTASVVREEGSQQTTSVRVVLPKVTKKADTQAPAKAAPIVTQTISDTESVAQKTIQKEPGKLEAIEDDVSVSVDYATIQQKWPQVLAKVKTKSVPMDGLLRATRLVGLEGPRVVIEASYQFHKEQMELARNSQVLEVAMEEVFGEPLKLRFVLGALAKPSLHSPDNNVSGKVEDEGLVKAAEDAFL